MENLARLNIFPVTLQLKRKGEILCNTYVYTYVNWFPVLSILFNAWCILPCLNKDDDDDNFINGFVWANKRGGLESGGGAYKQNKKYLGTTI